jgi:Dolichyl-phosphate-mannose-protein mannosyltransferase
MPSAHEILERLKLRDPFDPPALPDLEPGMAWDRNWPELAVIAVAVVLYWRASMASGVPLAIDSVQRSLLNPILALPVLIGGVASGVRFELLLGLLAAATGMWWLGVTLGLGRLGRIWASLAFTFAGGVIAGLAIGRFGLDLGSVWLPWAMSCAILAVRQRRALYAALAAAALALALLGSDLGLTIATALVLVLFVGVAGISVRQERPYVRLRPSEAAIAGLVALMGLGLAAIQVVPQISTAFGGPPVALAQEGRGMGQFLGGLAARTEGTMPSGPYTYLGLAPIVFLAGLPLAVREKNHRMVLGLGLVTALALVGASAGWLRATGSPLALWVWGALAALALAALGLDALWRWSVGNLRLRRMHVPAVVRLAAAWLTAGTLVLLIVSSLLDLYRAYRTFPTTGKVPSLARLSLGDAIQLYLTQHPVAFWVGASLSAVTLCGLIALILHDWRSHEKQSVTDLTGAGAVAVKELPEAPMSADPWRLPAWQGGFLLLVASMVGLILFLRLFKLFTLQSEIYGDVSMVRNYVANVLAGHWPTRFDLSAGPLYHYLIASIVSVVGLNYDGLKLASVMVSLGALAATYALSRRLINDYFALLTTFIAGVSSWLLIFSRLGNSQILLPLLTAASLWLVVRVVQFDRQSDLVACAIVSALGLYVYPQSFVLPVVIFLTLLCLRWAGLPVSRGRLGSFLLVAMLCAIPFLFIARSDIPNFTVGYLGSKITTEGDPVHLLGSNIVKAMLAFHVRGDEGFRSNPSGLPHLDWISGLLLLGGTLFWFTSRERRRWIPLWLVPFFLLQAPSILALNQPHEVPSASRTLGIAPIVYLLVASGLWWLIQAMHARGRQWPLVAAVTGVLLGGIVFLNAQRYFGAYISGLPYEDTPIGHLIANYADEMPADTQVYMVGCCWEHSIPDRFVDKEVARPQNWHYIEATDLSCLKLQFLESPAVFVWSFRDALPAPQLEACRHWLPAQLYTYQDRPVFYAAPLRPDLPAVSAAADQKAQPKAGLEVAPIEVDGQTVDLVYSKLDMGSPPDMFDDDVSSLARGLEANPFVLEFHFPESRYIRGLGADFATMDFVVTAKLYADERAEPRVYTQEFRGLAADPHIDMTFDDAPGTVRILRLEILQLDPPPDVHIHVREVKFR